MINGYRIKQAREIRGLSPSNLAEWCGLNEYGLHRIEAKLSECPSSTLERIALKVGFPMAFFKQGDPPEFPMPFCW